MTSRTARLRSTLTALLALTLLALPVRAEEAAPAAGHDTYEVDAAHTYVGFKIRHIVTKVKGEFNTFSGTLSFDPKDLATARITGEIDAASIDTNNEKRDKHLRSEDFFNVAKNPKITFKSTKVEAAGKDTFKVTGDLAMNGVTLPVTLDAEVTGFGTDPWGNQKMGATISGKINRKDFGIVWNKTLDAGGVMLGDEVELILELEANKKK